MGVLHFTLHFSETVDLELLVFNKTSASGKNWQLPCIHKGISEKLFVIPKLDAARVYNSKTSFLIGKVFKTRLNNGKTSQVYLRLDRSNPLHLLCEQSTLLLSLFFFFSPLIKLHVYIPNAAELCYI